MLKLGATASNSHMDLCRELQTVFHRNGIDFDWVLYSGYDSLVDAFVRKEIDIAWNGPLSYVKIRRALKEGCRNLIMRDVDVNFATQFITRPDSGITTVEDLPGKRFACGARSSVEAGVLAYHYLKDLGIVPQRDLAACTFFDQRQPSRFTDQRDVIERVLTGEYDAGAVSRRTLDLMDEQGTLRRDEIRVFWTSPGYSHCCFTAHRDLDTETSKKVTDAFLAVDPKDSAGKAVLEAEECKYFVPGIAEGWDTLEKVAEEEGLI